MLIKVLNKETSKIEVIESEKISDLYLHLSWRKFTKEELEIFWFNQERDIIIKEGKKSIKKK